MSIPITKQGKVSETGTILYKSPRKKVAKIKLLTFTDSGNVPFTLTLYKYNHNTGIGLIPLYPFELNGGDVVVDDNGYILNENEYVKAFSTSANTKYVIEVIDDPSIR